MSRQVLLCVVPAVSPLAVNLVASRAVSVPNSVLKKTGNYFTSDAIASRAGNARLKKLAAKGIACPFITPHLHDLAPAEVKDVSKQLSYVDSLLLYYLAKDARANLKGKKRLSKNDAVKIVRDVFGNLVYLGSGSTRYTFYAAGSTGTHQDIDGKIYYADSFVVKVCHTLCPVNGWELGIYQYAEKRGLEKMLATPLFISSTIAVFEAADTRKDTIKNMPKGSISTLAQDAERLLDIQDVVHSNGQPVIKNLGVRTIEDEHETVYYEPIVVDYAEPSRVIGFDHDSGLATFEKFLDLG